MKLPPQRFLLRSPHTLGDTVPGQARSLFLSIPLSCTCPAFCRAGRTPPLTLHFRTGPSRSESLVLYSLLFGASLDGLALAASPCFPRRLAAFPSGLRPKLQPQLDRADVFTRTFELGLAVVRMSPSRSLCLLAAALLESPPLRTRYLILLQPYRRQSFPLRPDWSAALPLQIFFSVRARPSSRFSLSRLSPWDALLAFNFAILMARNVSPSPLETLRAKLVVASGQTCVYPRPSLLTIS